MKVLLIALLGITAVIASSIENARFQSQRGGKSTTCDCGWRKRSQSRIVGGTNAGAGEFPYAVHIRTTYHNGKSFVTSGCTGSIINKRQVLTAGHCVRFNVNGKLVDAVPSNVLITYGHVNSRRGFPANSLRASNIKIHDNFDIRKNLNYDIALLTIAKPFNIGPDGNVGPICLPSIADFMPRNETDVIAAGWGLTSMLNEKQATPTDLLQKVHLTRNFNIHDCDAKWAAHYNKVSDRIFELHGQRVSLPTKMFTITSEKPICTYDIGQSTCPGDSGGPLVWYNPQINRYFLVGVTSFGPHAMLDIPGCIGLNGFTDVGKYLRWIQQNLAPGENVCTNN